MDPASQALRKAEAAVRFDALPQAAQMALARKIVQTRARELVLAYDGVTMVTAGFRLRRDGDSTPFVYSQPCVILGVERKWADDGGTGEAESHRIPRRLLAYGAWRGKRVLYAVQTDVQPQHWFHGGVARAASAVRVQSDDPQYTGNGTIACVACVRMTGGTTGFGLSALHVLSPAPELDLPAPAAGAPFHLVGCGIEGGTSAGWGGRLCKAAPSFDAQLADLGDGAWLGTAFAGLSLSPSRAHLRSREEFDALAAQRRFLILAPGNHANYAAAPRDPMVAQFPSYVPCDVPIGYKVRAGGVFTVMPIRHPELLMLEVMADSPAPEPGDSGSAVITWRTDGTMTVAGMFIASKDGNEARTVFVLPSWQLFNIGNWSALPPGTNRITPSFTLP